MKKPADTWDADSPEIETLIKAVMKDGDSYGIAMGELLSALFGLSLTLRSHQAVSGLIGLPEDPSADEAQPLSK